MRSCIKKEMRVGYLNFEPCVLRDSQSGRMAGIYVDMVNHIAKAIDVKVVWSETTLANFAAGLQSRQFDFSVGPTFVTIARATAVSFTQPVNYVGNSGVVKASSSFKPRSATELKKAGLRIAVLQGQALEEYCRRNLPDASLVVIAGGDLNAPLAAVSAGRADIGLMNSVTIAATPSSTQRFNRSSLERTKSSSCPYLGQRARTIQTCCASWTAR